MVTNAWLHCRTLAPHPCGLLCYLSAEPGHSEQALCSHKGTLFRTDELVFENRAQEAVQKNKSYMKQLSSEAPLDGGEYMVDDYAGLGVDSATLWSEDTMEMLEEDIKELRQTNVIDGLDAEYVVGLFEEEEREPVCHKVYGANLVKSVVKSALENSDDTVCIGSSDMTDKGVENASSRPPALFQGARGNTWLELAKVFIKKTEELWDNGEDAGPLRREEWLGALRLDVFDMETKRRRTSCQGKIAELFHK